MSVKVLKFFDSHINTEVKDGRGSPWRMTFIYGEPSRPLRCRTWELMKHIMSDSDLPWVCLGDFNEILRREEQLGPNEWEEYLMVGFREVVNVCQPCDIGYVGLDWTFEKRTAGGHFVRVKLDRALASATWCSSFPRVLLRHLTAANSDHYPILLSFTPDERPNQFKRGKLFRYEKLWETNKLLSLLVQQVWRDGDHCNTVKDLYDKLAHLREELQAWGESSFG